MKKKKIKKYNKGRKKFIKGMFVIFDDSEFFNEQDYSDIPDLTEEEIDKMIEDLKNS